MFAPGLLIGGRYRLVRVLGSGGMGVVWLAMNETISREVAIKVLLPQVARDPVALQRFFNEARICGSLRHPGMVDVLDLGCAEDGSAFLVMERLDGAPLEALAARGTRLEPAAILPILRDVAKTLHLAHSHGVIHRDLKPANLFLHRDAAGHTVVKVLDFGISKVSDGPASLGLGKPAEARVTRAGAVVGSPAYMSPEQAGGRVEIDSRSDIYALGVILYEALTGRLPFTDTNYNSLIIDIATKKPPDIQTLAPALPAPVVQLVRDAMARDRERRISSSEELARRIDEVLAVTGSTDASLLLAMANSGEGAPNVAAVPDPNLAASSRAGLSLSTSSRERTPPPAWMSVGMGVCLAFIVSFLVLMLVLRLTPKAAPAPVASEPAAAASPPAAPTAIAEAATANATATVTASAVAPPAAPPTAAPSTSASAQKAPAAAPKPTSGKGRRNGIFSYD